MAINLPILSSLNTTGFDKAKKEFASLSKTSDKAAFLLKKSVVPATAAVTALAGGLAMAAKAAIEDEKSTKLLEAQLRATLGPNQALADSIGNFVDQTQLASGVADDELRPALAGLVRFTGDATKAQDLLTLSLDASIATGKDLSSVSTAIGKAYDGNFTALKKLGIPLDESIIKSKDFAEAQKALTAQFGGAAAANALTFSGRLAILKIRFDELVESVGYRVLPVLDKALNYVEDLAKASDERGLGGVLMKLAYDFSRLTNPITNFTAALAQNTREAEGFGAKAQQAAFNALNWGGSLVNLAGSLFGVEKLIPNLNTEIDTLNRNFAEAYNRTKLYSQVILQLDSDRKRANYQAAVATQTEKELAKTVGTSTGVNKAAEAQAKKTAAALARQAEAARKLEAALDEAVQTVKDKFSPALLKANDALTKAQDTYNDFYNSTRDVVSGLFDVGKAFTDAAESEGAETFFGNLQKQAEKAGELSKGIEDLIKAGLDDPELLRQILAAGGDTGLEIIKSILAGGKESIDRLAGLSKTVGDAATKIATLTAGKWFKSGVDQATKIVEGINSVISATEFELKFVTTVEGAQAAGATFEQNVATVVGGGTPETPSNPFGGILGSINATPNTIYQGNAGAVSSQSVNINVNGGDPNAVVSALRSYMRTNGSVPIKISNAY
jgi:hypothetical protein